MPEQQESEMVALAGRLNALGLERTEQSSERSYLNADRNLAALVHAAATLMILGFAIDRYRLRPALASVTASFHRHFITGTQTTWSAAALIALAVLITFIGGMRYLAFILDYRRRHVLLPRYGPLLSPVLALLVAAFGLATLTLLFIAGR